MKLKSYLMHLQEHNQQPENSKIHNHFKSAAELRKWFYEEHSPEFYRRLRDNQHGS